MHRGATHDERRAGHLPDGGLLTRRVRQVLDIFTASPGTVFTADAVYQTLVSRGTPVSLSCIYRITRQLSQAGLLVCEPGRGGFGGGKHQFRRVQGGVAAPVQGQSAAVSDAAGDGPII